MQKITIALGTTSEQKKEYLKEILEELNISVKLLPLSVSSGVSEQPKTSQETENGAINRAAAALNLTPTADIGLGIEVGYHQEKYGYEMFCWVAIIGHDGHQLTNQSHKFLLPKYHQQVLEQGKFMNESLDNYSGASFQHKGHEVIDDIVRHREPIIKNAIKYALVRYLAREDY